MGLGVWTPSADPGVLSFLTMFCPLFLLSGPLRAGDGGCTLPCHVGAKLWVCSAAEISLILQRGPSSMNCQTVFLFSYLYLAFRLPVSLALGRMEWQGRSGKVEWQWGSWIRWNHFDLQKGQLMWCGLNCVT